VKDLRTKYETGAVKAAPDGAGYAFIEAYLLHHADAEPSN